MEKTDTNERQYLPDATIDNLVSPAPGNVEQQLVWRAIFKSLDALNPDYHPDFLNDDWSANDLSFLALAVLRGLTTAAFALVEGKAAIRQLEESNQLLVEAQPTAAFQHKVKSALCNLLTSLKQPPNQVDRKLLSEALELASDTKCSGTHFNELFEDLDLYVNPAHPFDGICDTIYEGEHDTETRETYYPVEVTSVIEAFWRGRGGWRFWSDWYDRFARGTPMPWEFQCRLSQIDDSTWRLGPEAVAEEIERIKGEFEQQLPKEPRFPAYEPNTLRPLIQNRIIATASLQGLAVQISGAIEQYHADTGANALPGALSPLQDMPALMNAIADRLAGIQQPDNISPETEQDMREEIGRLNAKVAELESKLGLLKQDIAKLSSAERAKYLSLLRKTAIWSSVASCFWVVSGDNLGARARFENTITYVNDIRSLFMREGLPQTQVKTSLRPRTRPDDGV